MTKLKRLRKKKRLNQESVCFLVGITQGMLSKLENDQEKIKSMALITAVKLAKIYECDVKDFL